MTDRIVGEERVSGGGKCRFLSPFHPGAVSDNLKKDCIKSYSRDMHVISTFYLVVVLSAFNGLVSCHFSFISGRQSVVLLLISSVTFVLLFMFLSFYQAGQSFRLATLSHDFVN